MRLLLYFTEPTEPFGLDYKPKIMSCLYAKLRLIAPDKQQAWHDRVSLHSFSNLLNTKYDQSRQSLTFKRTTRLEISSWDAEFLKTLCYGLRENNDFIHGAKVGTVQICERRTFSEEDVFRLASPMLFKAAVKRREDRPLETLEDKVAYLADEGNKDRLAASLAASHRTRAAAAGLDAAQYGDASFELQYPAAVKIVKFKKGLLPAVYARVKAKGNPAALQFAYYTGLGSKIGCGFGSIL